MLLLLSWISGKVNDNYLANNTKKYNNMNQISYFSSISHAWCQLLLLLFHSCDVMHDDNSDDVKADQWVALLLYSILSTICFEFFLSSSSWFVQHKAYIYLWHLRGMKNRRKKIKELLLFLFTVKCSNFHIASNTTFINEYNVE